MAIIGLSDQEFRSVLRENLTSARAISNPEHLRGRQTKLDQIDRAFNSQGKHAFIYGDRGVGKTSLALSAAVLHQSSENGPIFVSCDQGLTCFKLVGDIVRSVVPAQDIVERRRSTHGFRLNLFGLGADVANSLERGHAPEIGSINEAIVCLNYVKQFHSKEPVVIVDEFDQLTAADERKKFADLIKQVSDRNIGIRLIMTGIGKSLDDLIGAHLSTGRYLSSVELERLSHDARWEILRHAAASLNISIDEEYVIRIGQISDGFPYYAHLAGEMIFWSAFRDARDLDKVTYDNFAEGIRDASREAEATLRGAYDRATQKYKGEYEETLWALADKPHLRRQIREVYENSYIRIAEDYYPKRKPMDLRQFYGRMNNLKTERHGRIIETTSAGWYQFRENVVRGYVRLRAEQSGVQLDRDVLR